MESSQYRRKAKLLRAKAADPATPKEEATALWNKAREMEDRARETEEVADEKSAIANDTVITSRDGITFTREEVRNWLRYRTTFQDVTEDPGRVDDWGREG